MTGEMNDLQKLRILLPHWIDHNRQHGTEYADWADRAAAAGDAAAATMIHEAAEAIRGANDTLQSALDELGGAIHRTHHAP
jgi:hypothetical protein